MNSHSSIEIHAHGSGEPNVRYFQQSAERDDFVAIGFEGARGSLIRWENGQVVVRVDAAKSNLGSVYLSSAEARQLAESILAALPAEAAQEAA